MEGVYRIDAATAGCWWSNPAFVQMLGYAIGRGAVRDRRARRSTGYPSDRDTFVRRIESDGEVRNDEYRAAAQGRHHARGGRQRPGGARQAGARWSDTRARIADITERKKAETAVFQAKERAQVTLQSIGDAVITTDSEGRIDYMNPVAESLDRLGEPRGAGAS